MRPKEVYAEALAEQPTTRPPGVALSLFSDEGITVCHRGIRGLVSGRSSRRRGPVSVAPQKWKRPQEVIPVAVMNAVLSSSLRRMDGSSRAGWSTSLREGALEMGRQLVGPGLRVLLQFRNGIPDCLVPRAGLLLQLVREQVQ